MREDLRPLVHVLAELEAKLWAALRDDSVAVVAEEVPG